MSGTDNIKRIKVWITDQGRIPTDSTLVIDKSITQEDLKNEFVFDVWVDYISDGIEKKKETEIKFRHGQEPPIGEVVADFVYEPSTNINIGTPIRVDGTRSRPSSSSASIVSWKWTVRNEGGMTYPVVDADKPQANFITPDLNWMYIRLDISDSNGKSGHKEVYVDIGEPQPVNHPPVADAGIDQTVKPNTIVTLNGSKSYDPDTGDTITHKWIQTFGFKNVEIQNSNQATATFLAPALDQPTDEAKAIIKVPSLVDSLTQVIIDGTQSIADSLIVTQISGDAQVKLNEIQKWKWDFTAPDGDFTLGFQGIARKGTSQSIVQVSIQVTKQPQGDINEHGTRLLYRTTGKRVVMQKGSAHRNGQRYNVNHKYQNYMMIGYYKIATNQKQIEVKMDGPNHGDCKKLPECMWYEPDLYVDGTVRLGMEYPHPDNHAVDNSALDVNAPLKAGDLRGKWIAYSTIAYYNKEGLRVIEQWADPDPFDANGKPKNNWQLTLKATERGQLFPKQYFPRTLPVDFDEGLECEIRMHAGEQTPTADFKWAYVYEIAQPSMSKFALPIEPVLRGDVCRPKEEIENWDDEIGRCDHNEPDANRWKNFENGVPANTQTLGFQLTVTDSKGAFSVDNVNIIVSEEPQPTKKPPVADFTFTPIQPKANDMITLDGSIASYDPDGTITEYSWTARDQAGGVNLVNSNAKVSNFTYAEQSDYVDVTLTVTDNDSLTNSKTKRISKTIQPDGEEWIFAQVGDTHGEKEPLEQIVTKHKPFFLVHTGDVTDTEKDDDNYIQYTKDLGLTYGKDFANSEGNHESKEESGEGAKEDLENAFPALKENEWLQMYHIKNVVIIVGNTQAPGYSQVDSNAGKWMKDTLVKAKQIVDSGQADWIFLVQHKPFWTMKARHESEFNFRYNFHPLLDQYGVDICFHGHNHDMQRTYPILYVGNANTPPKINDKKLGDAHDMSIIPHGIVVNINGSSTKNTKYSEDKNAWTIYAEASKNGYSILKIKGKTITGQYIEVGSGNVLHEYKLAKG